MGDRGVGKARLGKEPEGEPAQLGEARRGLAAGGPTRLSAMSQLPRDAFELLLDLLAEALSRKLTPDDEVTATSADGSIELHMTPTADGALARIETIDGALTGRRVALVVLPEAGDYVDGLVDTLELAGADVTGTVRFTDRFVQPAQRRVRAEVARIELGDFFRDLP